jgi:cell division protein FtsB
MKDLKVNSSTGINLPIGNLISIIGACLVAAWFGFSIIERVNKLETQTVLMEKDVEKAVEFSIKWPRGELGSLPADSEQFLLIESLLTDVEDLQAEMKSMRHNVVNIERLQKDVDKILEEMEKLKDKVRKNGNHN